MDSTHHQPNEANLERPASPAPAPAPVPPAAAPQEATGDSESDAPAVSSAITVGDRPSVAGYDEDDAESSCSGAGGVYGVRAASIDDDGHRGEDDGVAMKVDEDEVDSRMDVSWWRRTVQAAADGGGGGCARPQAAAAIAGHSAESNRLFWEACIAHGY